ncbi:MAG: hypothetical protein ACM3MK_08320 [Chitinophagales bacterium]
MKNKILIVAWGYLGAVVGAGFASGQEILQFFVRYENDGLKGIIISGVLFALFGYILMSWAARYGLNNYQSAIKKLFGPVSTVMDIVLSIFLFLGTCTMLSASGAVFYEHLYLPKNLGIICAYLGIVLFLIGGHNGLVKAYNLLVPTKILLLLILAGSAVLFQSHHPGPVPSYLLPPVKHSWLLAGILYTAYNFSLAMVVLIEYLKIASPGETIIGATIGGIILGFIIIICYLALSKHLPVILHYEIPMLYVAGSLAPFAKYIYLLVLWLGILTTAIGNTYGFAQRFSHFSGLGYTTSLLVSVSLALPLAFQSFATLVASIYPAFGCAGVVLLITLGVRYLGNRLSIVTKGGWGRVF